LLVERPGNRVGHLSADHADSQAVLDERAANRRIELRLIDVSPSGIVERRIVGREAGPDDLHRDPVGRRRRGLEQRVRFKVRLSVHQPAADA